MLPDCLSFPALRRSRPQQQLLSSLILRLFLPRPSFFLTSCDRSTASMTKGEKKDRLPPPSPKLATSPPDPPSPAISTIHASGVPSLLPPSESNLRSTSQISLPVVSSDVTPPPPTQSFSSMEPKTTGGCKPHKSTSAEPLVSLFSF